MTSWVRHEALLQVENAYKHRCDVCIQLWFVFLDQQRFKNLQPSSIVVTANDLGVLKVDLGWFASACRLMNFVTFDTLPYD